MTSPSDLAARSQNSLRHHGPTIARLAAGVTGLTALGLLAAGGVVPFLPEAIRESGAAVLWGGLSSNVLAEWLHKWAQDKYRWGSGDETPDEGQLLADLAADLWDAIDLNLQLADDVAVLLKQTDALNTVLGALQGQHDQQVALLQQLEQDVEDGQLRSEQLTRIVVTTVASQCRRLRADLGAGQAEILEHCRQLLGSMARLEQAFALPDSPGPALLPWPRADWRGLARFVNPEVVRRAQLALPVVEAADRRALVAALYERLRSCGIRYTATNWQPDQRVLPIATPAELLDGPRAGTSLDLAVLFCAACLGNKLLPVLVVTPRHAIAVVSLRHSQAEWNDDCRAQIGLQQEDHGLWHTARLQELVAQGHYLALECTGFATGTGASTGLDFEEALRVGGQHMAGTLDFAADIAALHELGFGPPPPHTVGLIDALADALLQASSAKVRNRLGAVERRAALHAALDQAVAIAAAGLSQHQEAYAELVERFGTFARRPVVVEELSQLLDPRAEGELDQELLLAELDACGLGEAAQVDGAALIRALARAFCEAAEHDPLLQGAIQIGLLRMVVERLGALERVAVASEQIVTYTSTITEQLRQLVIETVQGRQQVTAVLAKMGQAIEALPGRASALFPILAAALGNANITVAVDDHGALQIIDERPNEDRTTNAFTQIYDLLVSLRQDILRADGMLSPLERAARRQGYLELLVGLYRDLRLEGLSTGARPLVLPLEQIYVQLRAVAEVPEAADAFSPEERRLLRMIEEAECGRPIGEAELREARLRLDAIRRERWTGERLERFPIGRALADQQRRGLVILGDPGSGKSTLLQFLALVFAQGPARAQQQLGLQGAETERLPIPVPLASYDDMLRQDPELSVRDFLARYYDRRRALPGLAPIFGEALDGGQALVLLDGLDEVVDEQRRMLVAEQVSSFTQVATARGNRVVVTSRIYGYRVAPLRGDLPHITVLDFRREEIELFARQWYRALRAWEHDGPLTPQLELEAQRDERELLAEVRGNPGVEQLAVNPLLLTMLVLLRRQVGRLPQRRIRLYDQYVNALVETWQDNRNRGARTHPVARVDLREAEGALIDLALWLQQHRPSGTATRADLLGQLARYYLWEEQGIPSAATPTPPQRRRAEERAEHFLQDMRQFSGLLIERGQGAFGFRHLTFQEYFAGRALARMPTEVRWALLRENLHSNRWREPLLLAGARLGVSEQRVSEATELVEWVLHAGSPHEDVLHRDLLLAADCAADDIGTAQPLLNEIVAGLRALLRDRVPALPIAALWRLFHLSLLKAGEQTRMPELVKLLLAELPVELVSGRFGQLDAARQALLQALVREHTDVQATFVARLVDDRSGMRRGVAVPHRPAVVEALAPLAASEPAVRQALLAALVDKHPNVRPTVVRALAPLAASEPAVRQALLAALADENPGVRPAVVRALAPLVASESAVRQALLAALADENPGVRPAVVRALAPLAASEPAVRQVLLATLADENPDVRPAAVWALAPLAAGEPAVRQVLLAALADENPGVRPAVVEALASLAAGEPAVRQVLLAALSDADTDVRQAVIEALAPLAAGEPAVRQVLLAALSDADNHVRRAVIEQLQRYCATDQSVLHALQQMLHHREQEIRQTTIIALLSLRTQTVIQLHQWYGQRADFRCGESYIAQVAAIEVIGSYLTCGASQLDDPLHYLISYLGDASWTVRRAVVEALAPLAARDPAVRQALLVALADADTDVRQAVVEALMPLAAGEPAVRRALLATLADDNPDMRQVVVEALAARAPVVRQALLLALADDNPDMRQVVVEALAARAPLVWQALLALLADDRPAVHTVVVEALAPLAASAPEVRQVLLTALADADWNVRQAVVEMLAPLAASAPEVRQVLQAALADADNDVRQAVVEALAPLAASAPEVRQVLQAALADTSPSVRQMVVLALAPLAASAPEVRQALLAALADIPPNVRQAVVALAPLAASAPEVRQALLAALADTSPSVRQAVVQALAPLVEGDPALRQVFVVALADPDNDVRQAVVQALAPLIAVDAALYQRLLPLLGREDVLLRVSSRRNQQPLHARLVAAYGAVVRDNPQRRAEAIALLGHVDWRLRKAAALMLGAAGAATVQEALPQLLAALEDERGLEAQSVHVAMAELLINDDRHSAEAINVILRALDYDVNALFPLREAVAIRRQAALALGKLKAAYRTPVLVERTLALLEREQDARVLDSLYAALGSLAAAPELE